MWRDKVDGGLSQHAGGRTSGISVERSTSRIGYGRVDACGSQRRRVGNGDVTAGSVDQDRPVRYCRVEVRPGREPPLGDDGVVVPGGDERTSCWEFLRRPA
jgi:hypothetical protein